MLNSARIKQGDSSEQGQLLPVYPSDLVPEDHLARVVSDVVDMLDLTPLYQKYGKEGGEFFHPKSMFKILFYGYSQGDRSSRLLMRQCRENFVFMFLAAGITPDFRTISEFRRKHLDILKAIFKQIVHLCHELGMVNIGRISLDGTKVKANASDSNIAEKDKLSEELADIEQQIADILNEAEAIDNQEDERFGPNNDGNQVPEKLQKIQNRKQEIESLLTELNENDLNKMSLTDKETRFMKNHGRIQLCYNAQCATENQVILACDLDNNEDDRSSLIPMVSALEEIATELTGKEEYPLENTELPADSGYESGENLQHLAERKIDAYVASQFYRVRKKEERGEIPARPFSKDKFHYHEDGDYYECPVGKKLEFKRAVTRKKTGITAHYYQCTDCPNCAFKNECVTSKTGYRQIARFPGYDPYRAQIDIKIQTPYGKKVMRHRAMDVEPVFGQLKETILRQKPFLLRGLQKAKGEFRLVCIVHNLKKIAKHLRSIKKGGISLKSTGIQLKIA